MTLRNTEVWDLNCDDIQLLPGQSTTGMYIDLLTLVYYDGPENTKIISNQIKHQENI